MFPEFRGHVEERKLKFKKEWIIAIKQQYLTNCGYFLCSSVHICFLHRFLPNISVVGSCITFSSFKSLDVQNKWSSFFFLCLFLLRSILSMYTIVVKIFMVQMLCFHLSLLCGTIQLTNTKKKKKGEIIGDSFYLHLVDRVNRHVL